MGRDGVDTYGHNLWKLMLAAVGTTIALNLITLLLPALYSNFFYGTIQVLWPLLILLILGRIYFRETDGNIRRLILIFILAMIAWSATVLLWEVILFAIQADDIYYYISGFGYLIAYMILVYGLMEVRHSRQWYLSPPINLFINIVGVIAIITTLIVITPGIQVSDPRALDMAILLGYILCDISILILCAKLLNMDIKDEMKYLVSTIGGFVLVNACGDILFEIRWMLHTKTIFDYKISTATDIVYTISLVFVAISLLFYLSSSRDRLLATISKKISDARPYVQDIIANSPDAMFLCDVSGRLAIVNEPMSRLLNQDKASLVGKFDFFDYLCKVDKHMIPAIERLKKGESYTLAKLKIDGSGTDNGIYVSMRLFPLLDARREISGYAGIIQDITEQLHNEQELAESKRQVELYMDIMSHDINNMNQIGMGHLEIARMKIDSEGKLGPESMHYIEKPIEVFTNSSKLISNIRMIKKVRAGDVNYEQIDLGAILAEIVRDYTKSVDRDITINYVPASGLNVKANYLLREVFSNLVGNAIKHSDQKKPLIIDIRTRVAVRDDKRYYQTIIEDDGPGVPDANKSAIFDRVNFGRTKQKGRGIGLYIVRTLVESYGGRIWVEDRTPGNRSAGARFIVELPADTAPESLPEKTVEQA